LIVCGPGDRLPMQRRLKLSHRLIGAVEFGGDGLSHKRFGPTSSAASRGEVLD